MAVNHQEAIFMSPNSGAVAPVLKSSGNARRVTVHSIAAAALAAFAMAASADVAAAQTSGGEGDRFVLSGTAEVARGETVGDVFVLDGSADVRGTVTGDVVVLDGPARVSGTVAGDVVTPSGQAVIGSTASVGGDVIHGEARPVMSEGAEVAGTIERADWRAELDGLPGSFDLFGGFLAWLAVGLAALAVGVALLWLAPGASGRAVEVARTRFGASAGIGLAVAIGSPVAAGFSMLTIIGIPLGLALLLALLPIYAIGYAMAGWVLGRRILPQSRRPLLALVAGLAVLRLLALVPLLGGLVGFVATVVGLGALTLATFTARSHGAPAGAAVSA